MTVKVGDIVHYQGRNVRIMKMNGNIRLAYFGHVSDTFTDSDVIEPNEAPEFKVGDDVIIREIPKEERKQYGAGWLSGMENMFDTTHTIAEVRDDEHGGKRVKLRGIWFQTYHLEYANSYDII